MEDPRIPLGVNLRLSPTDLTQIQDAFLCLGLAIKKGHAPKSSSFQQQTQKRIALAEPLSAEQILPIPAEPPSNEPPSS